MYPTAVRGVASPKTPWPGATNFWFGHSTACNKLCVVEKLLKELKVVVRSVRTSHACNFRDIVESQPGLQLVEKLVTPLAVKKQTQGANKLQVYTNAEFTSPSFRKNGVAYYRSNFFARELCTRVKLDRLQIPRRREPPPFGRKARRFAKMYFIFSPEPDH